MMTGLDLRAPIAAICDAAGVDYTAVRRMEFWPGKLVVDVLKRNEDGSFYIDVATGQAVADEFIFKVERS